MEKSDTSEKILQELLSYVPDEFREKAELIFRRSRIADVEDPFYAMTLHWLFNLIEHKAEFNRFGDDLMRFGNIISSRDDCSAKELSKHLFWKRTMTVLLVLQLVATCFLGYFFLWTGNLSDSTRQPVSSAVEADSFQNDLHALSRSLRADVDTIESASHFSNTNLLFLILFFVGMVGCVCMYLSFSMRQNLQDRKLAEICNHLSCRKSTVSEPTLLDELPSAVSLQGNDISSSIIAPKVVINDTAIQALQKIDFEEEDLIPNDEELNDLMNSDESDEYIQGDVVLSDDELLGVSSSTGDDIEQEFENVSSALDAYLNSFVKAESEVASGNGDFLGDNDELEKHHVAQKDLKSNVQRMGMTTAPDQEKGQNETKSEKKAKHRKKGDRQLREDERLIDEYVRRKNHEEQFLNMKQNDLERIKKNE